MITPIFQLDQNEKFLIVKIRAPHCKLADAEINYGGNVFLFHASPYFLRLFLTSQVVEDGGTCDYTCDEGQFTICMLKKKPGEYFPKLEMLSELLKPQKRMPNAQRLVGIVGSNKENRANMGDESKIDEDEESGEEAEYSINDELLYAEQRLCKDGEECSANRKFGYGFGWTRHGILGKFNEEIAELIDLDDYENVPIGERIAKLAEFDAKHFQEQHYLADLFSPEQLQLDAMSFSLDKEQHLILDEEDRTELKDLKIRQLEKFSKETNEQIALSLIDLLFGFHYDLRTTLAEHNVESGWTISKLSPSLTFLVRWPNARETVIGTVRHSFILPLIRNWDLSMKVLKDVFKTLKIGRTAILHCLLVCRRIFNRSGDFRYLYNQLFVDDLCLWIQSVKEEFIVDLRENLKTEMSSLKKSDMLELDLEFIEAQARLEMLKPMDSDDDDDESRK